MKPHVGAIVHWYDEQGTGPYAAVVTAASRDGLRCDLHVFGRGGEPHTVYSVLCGEVDLQTGAPSPACVPHGTWYVPPSTEEPTPLPFAETVVREVTDPRGDAVDCRDEALALAGWLRGLAARRRDQARDGHDRDGENDALMLRRSAALMLRLVGEVG